MSTEIENMKIWDSVCKTDPKHTNEVKYGRKFTAIDAHYQVRELTKKFGPCGIGWGVADSQYSLLINDPNDHNQNVLEYTAKFWFVLDGKRGEFDISAGIECYEYSNKHSKWLKVGDIHKKVKTSALSKGISLLGFNADIFMGLYEDNQYVQSLRNEFRDQKKEAGSSKPKAPLATEGQKELIAKYCKEARFSNRDFAAEMKRDFGQKWETMTEVVAAQMIERLGIRIQELEGTVA